MELIWQGLRILLHLKSAIEIHKDQGTYDSIIQETYRKCKTSKESGMQQKKS